jgi:hypothetical protein
MLLLLLIACQTTTTSARPAAALPPPPPPAPSRGGSETLPPQPPPPRPPAAPTSPAPTPSAPPRTTPSITPEPKDPFDEVDVRLTFASFAWRGGAEEPTKLFDALRARMDVEETPIAIDWALSGGWSQAELKGVLPAAALWARGASRTVGPTLSVWRGEGAEGWSLYADGRLVAARVSEDGKARTVGDLARAAELLGIAPDALDREGSALADALGIEADALVQTHELLQLPPRRTRPPHTGPLAVGTRVFASPYGVGEIVGESPADDAWLVHIADIPKVKVPRTAVRPIVSAEEAEALLGRLSGPARPLELPWEVRYRAFADRIRGGDPDEIADVLLWLRGSAADRAWTDGERKVAEHAARLLASEIATATGRPEPEVQQALHPKGQG